MQNEKSEYSVLVVDDDEDTRYALAKMLAKCGCDIAEVSSVEAALTMLSEASFDIVFSDMRFHGGVDGDVLLETVNQQYPDIEVVLMSCYMDAERKARLMEKGAAMCLEKPFFKDVCAETLAIVGDRFNRKAA